MTDDRDDGEHEGGRAQRTAQRAVDTVEDVAGAAEGGIDAADAARRGDPGAVAGGVTDGAADATDLAARVGAGTRAGRALERVAAAAGTIRQATRVARSVAGIAARIGDALADGDAVMNAVRYDFVSDVDPTAGWRVRSMQVREGICELYEASIELVNDDLSAEVERLLGGPAQLVMERTTETGGNVARAVQGIVTRVEQLGLLADRLAIRVRIEPALAALAFRRNHRIFQDMKAPDIVRQVLTEGLAPYGRSINVQLEDTYLTREYCVQHEESDLDFVRRLLEEEGIAWFFDHHAGSEMLHLVDSNAHFPEVTTLDGGPVPMRPVHFDRAPVESIQSFEWGTDLSATSVVVRDWDWSRIGARFHHEERGEDAHGRDREEYHFEPSTFSEWSDGSLAYGAEDVRARATRRRDEIRAHAARGHGRSIVTGLTPGHVFELQGFGHGDLDRRYLVTRVEHEGFVGTDREEGEDRPQYVNRLTCGRADLRFVPARTRRPPRIRGTQTAIVRGREGKGEIDCDGRGRVLVEFHWDRDADRELPSCWVRVMQSWAGQGFGTQFIPRVGMEVVVTFLEGNPDRPLVVGCVHNNANPAAYLLDDHKTRSYIRTHSTDSPNNAVPSNELRFEDLAGSEEVYLHAQKDLNELVENCHTTTVRASQTNTVGAEHTESVGANQHLTVQQDRDKTVYGNEYICVAGNEAVAISGWYNMDVVQHGTVTAGVHLLLKVGSSEIYMDGNQIRLVAGGATLHLTADHAELRSSQGSVARLTDDAQVRSVQGGKVFLDANALLQSNAGSYTQLDADATMRSTLGSVAHLTDTVKIAALGGSALGLEATTAIMQASSGGTVLLDVNATVSGALVKLNC